MTNIHTFLKEIRMEKGFTQEQVADKIGLTRQAISGYESGKRQPGIDILMKLAEVYEVEIETLLYGKRNAVGEKRVKNIAIIVSAIYLSLQLVTGILSTLAFILYPVKEGKVDVSQVEILEKHFAMSNIVGHVEMFALFILFLGSILIMGLDLSKKTSFSWRKKIRFVLDVWLVSWIIAIFFGTVHPMYGIVDYIIRGPFNFVYVMVFLLFDLVITFLKQRRSYTYD